MTGLTPRRILQNWIRKKMTKSTPLLMSGQMVLPTLDLSKTNTRRLRGLERINENPDDWLHPNYVDGLYGGWFFYHKTQPLYDTIKCPYGRKGDQLWIKETYMPDPPDDGTWSYVGWQDDKILRDLPERFKTIEHVIWKATWNNKEHALRGWKPSIHMPKWASRITLEIEDIYPERLQDISEEDAIAEGCKMINGFPEEQDHPKCGKVGWDSAKEWYSDLWEKINGEGSWNKNYWVWRIQFRRIK